MPNTVTALNIALGFVAILTTAQGRYETAVRLLVLAIILDAIDGRLARLLKATSSLGQQLDSFSDTICFGVAPAFLIHQALLVQLGPLGIATSLVYLLSGVYRLARFNVLADAHGKARRTLGLPIPAGASYLMAAVLMRAQLPLIAAATLVVLIAWAMSSRWALPELKGTSLVSVLMSIGVVNYLLVVFLPSWDTVLWWNLWNVVILVAARREDRRLTTAQT